MGKALKGTGANLLSNKFRPK